MRKVEYCEKGYFNHIGEKNKPQDIKEAVFYGFWQEGSIEEGTEALALLELPDGTMYYRAPRQIRFLKDASPVLRGSEIKKTMFHDEGAYGYCQKCKSYSDSPACLTAGYVCRKCGEDGFFTGFFKPPKADSEWEIDVPNLNHNSYERGYKVFFEWCKNNDIRRVTIEEVFKKAYNIIRGSNV